jgi:hypothetical protein
MASTNGHVRLGTRGSPMALWQARWVAAALQKHHPGLTTELVVMRTVGDKNRRDPLSRIGGKGLFVKEIEEALLRQEIDLAVHSMKDIPTTLPPGLHLSAVPPRDDVRDVFVGRGGRRRAEGRPVPGVLARAACTAGRSCACCTCNSRCRTSAAMWTRACAKCARGRSVAWSSPRLACTVWDCKRRLPSSSRSRSCCQPPGRGPWGSRR